MKTLLACFLTLFIQGSSWAQNNSSVSLESTNFDYNNGLVVTLDSTALGHIVNIGCLPQTVDYSVMLKIELDPKEVYTFMKSSDLFIPEGYAIYIRDEGADNVFDLNSKERHSFTTNRPITKYFLLERRKIEQLENLVVKVD